MLATRAYGINEGAADEPSSFAQMVTPIQEYGISIPNSGAEQYGIGGCEFRVFTIKRVVMGLQPISLPYCFASREHAVRRVG